MGELLSLERESCREHFNNLNILTVPSIYVSVLLSNMAKYKHEYETAEKRQIREGTRTQDIIRYKVQPNLNIVRHSPRYQSVILFNKLPLHIKSAIYSSSFKNNLKVSY